MKPGAIARSCVLLVVVGLSMASCASGGRGSSTRVDPDFILRSEIDESNAGTAYDLVQALRPQWLRTRGISTLQQAAGEEAIVVYMDNARLGPPNSMRQIPLGPVQYLRFFTAQEATERWGGGHLHGAILISTRSR